MRLVIPGGERVSCAFRAACFHESQASAASGTNACPKYRSVRSALVAAVVDSIGSTLVTALIDAVGSAVVAAVVNANGIANSIADECPNALAFGAADD